MTTPSVPEWARKAAENALLTSYDVPWEGFQTARVAALLVETRRKAIEECAEEVERRAMEGGETADPELAGYLYDKVLALRDREPSA